MNDRLPGVKNGRKTGIPSNIVVKNVVVNEKKQLSLILLFKKRVLQLQINFI